MISGVSPYGSEVLGIVTALSERFPDSNSLALNHVELLAEHGKAPEALIACERFLASFGVNQEILELGLELRSKTIPQPLNPTVSLCMIVKNEERYLAQCLASVKPIVDEIVVVDTGSSDQTVAVATIFGAQIHRFTWNGSFSDARNQAIARARGKWLLIMDADERISPLDHGLFRAMLQQSSPARDAWSMLIRNYSHRAHIQGWTANDSSYPEEEQADGWYPAERVRLFPNDPRIRYEGVVHELVEPALRANGFTIRTAPVVAHHYGEVDGLPTDLMQKQLRYYELGRQKLAKNPNDLVALAELAVQAGELEKFEEALELWNRLLQLRPDTVEALFGKGHALINLKHYSEALEASRQALKLDPQHREAAYNYGLCELYAGDPARALPVIERQLQQDRRNPQLLAMAAILYLTAGNNRLALEANDDLKAMNYDLVPYIYARTERLRAIGRSRLASIILDNVNSSGIGIAAK